MNRSLPFALVVLVFSGVFLMPGAPLDRAQGLDEISGRENTAGLFSTTGDQAQASTQMNSLSSSPVWTGGDTQLHREGDGHFYADVRIDGSPIRFMVDTGASMIALTGQDAQMLGISWSQEDIRPIGHGASGEVLGFPIVLERVELDDHRADRVSAVVIPEGLQVSLLGQSFLGTIPRVQIEGQTMVLGR